LFTAEPRRDLSARPIPCRQVGVQAQRAGAGARRVLVVEDDADVSALLASHLHRLGLDVVEADSGERGLEFATADPPDVVFVDMVLPGMDGGEVVAALRADERTRSCRIVFTSVLDPTDFTGLPFDALLPKPFTRRDVARLLAALDGSAAR
ncbi:MAG: response regulator, partial [Actinomycetota bacterium]|nr:response regulator [Actinomycetota bacterium]